MIIEKHSVISRVMKFGYKIWIEKDGDNVFGMGIFRLLSLVQETGSLHKAAQELRMSYRPAGGMVRDYEKRLGASLLEKGRHGRTGAHLTSEGQEIMKCFEEVMKEMEGMISAAPLAKLIERMEKKDRAED